MGVCIFVFLRGGGVLCHLADSASKGGIKAGGHFRGGGGSTHFI